MNERNDSAAVAYMMDKGRRAAEYQIRVVPAWWIRDDVTVLRHELARPALYQSPLNHAYHVGMLAAYMDFLATVA